MDSEEDEVSSTRPGFETTGDSTEAAKPSSDSTEPSIGRRGSKRRMETAVASPDSGGSRSGTEGPVRVLRARVAAADRTSESKNAPCKKKPTSLHRGRGRPAGSRTKNAPVMQ